jgi:hypothetical protein
MYVNATELKIKDIFKDVIIDLWLGHAHDNLPLIGVDLFVESDGRKAYVNLLDTPQTIYKKAQEA